MQEPEILWPLALFLAPWNSSRQSKRKLPVKSVVSSCLCCHQGSTAVAELPTQGWKNKVILWVHVLAKYARGLLGQGGTRSTGQETFTEHVSLFYPCASLKLLFAAAPWGSSKGFIISKAYTCLAHTYITHKCWWKLQSHCAGYRRHPVPGSL